MEEIDERGTFKALVDEVVSAKQKKEAFDQLVAKDQEGRDAVKSLRIRCKEVKDSMEREMKERDSTMRHLKDELHELRTQATAEVRYLKKETAMKLGMAHKDLQGKSKVLNSEAVELQRQIEEESLVNSQVEEFLRNNYKTLTDKLDYWMTKYERDNEEAQNRLNTLDSDRKRDLFRLQELTDKYAEFEKVVLDDRQRKEKQARVAQQAILELTAAIRLQAWWRGMLVRHKLGPFKAKKKSAKGKKGKKK